MILILADLVHTSSYNILNITLTIDQILPDQYSTYYKTTSTNAHENISTNSSSPIAPKLSGFNMGLRIVKSKGWNSRGTALFLFLSADRL